MGEYTYKCKECGFQREIDAFQQTKVLSGFLKMVCWECDSTLMELIGKEQVEEAVKMEQVKEEAKMKKYTYKCKKCSASREVSAIRHGKALSGYGVFCWECSRTNAPASMELIEKEQVKREINTNHVNKPLTREQNRLDRAKRIAETLNAKNKAYGDSFAKSGEVLSVLFPEISKEKATVILAIARIIDKLFRIANDPTAFGEDPAMDIAGYGMLLQELMTTNE